MPIFKASVTYLYPDTWGIFVDVMGMNWFVQHFTDWSPLLTSPLTWNH